MRAGSRTLALAVGALFLTPAMAQQPSSITLSCSGTGKLMIAADDSKQDPINNVGMVVDFQSKTVTFDNYKVPIERADSTMVLFRGSVTMTYANTRLKPVQVDGSVDRITGSASVTFTHERVGDNAIWDLNCKPATRMF